MKNIFKWIRDRQDRKRRKIYVPGKVITRSIARDIRREIKVISIDQLDEGIIFGQMRTNNLLYLKRGFVVEEEFGEPMDLSVDSMWKWSGQSWGGLPDGTSILEKFIRD